MTNPLAPLARRLAARAVRYLLIGVSGANLYAPSGQAFSTTDDFDLFLPSGGAALAPYDHHIPLRETVELMHQVHAGCWSLEAANGRDEHQWVVWQDVTLIEGADAGRIGHASNVMEHPELVMTRLDRFAQRVGRERTAGTDSLDSRRVATTWRNLQSGPVCARAGTATCRGPCEPDR